MTKEEAAAKLDGNEYREEGSRELFAVMKAAGLVAVYGASDDLMEFEGAIYDEVGAYEGGEAFVTPKGLLTPECGEDSCPHEARRKKAAASVKAVWHDGGGPCWTYETVIPHATFVINEDGEPYCRGIVFALADVPEAPR